MSEISVVVNGSTTINPSVGNGDTVAVTIASSGERGPTGSTGSAGPANTLSIGTVASGTAAATITGTAPAQTLSLVLPVGSTGATGSVGATGSQGPAGPANTLAIGTVASGTAAATITGTSPSQTLNLVLPVGATGATGSQGATGPAANLADETPQPLGTASAGTALSAARADHVHAQGSITYSGLSGIPSTFAPSAHAHAVADVAGLQAQLDGKQASGTYATLVNNQVPSANLPSFVDDVIEYSALSAFAATGEVGKIFVARDTGKIYRWSGSAYIEISPSPGSTDSVTEGSTNLYFTNTRAAAAAPVQSVAGRTGTITLAKSDVGLGSVDNTADAAKPVSTSQAAADAAVQAFSIQRTNHTGTQAASTISDFATEAAKYGPVTSVSGRTGAVTLAQLGTSGTASSTTFLRGDGAWTAAGSTDASLLTSGTVAATRLPLATTTLAGAVIVGSGLTITSGVLSRSSTYDPAAAPGAPSGISFTGYLVSWNPSPGGVATYYEVQWVISSGSYTTLATNVAGTTLGYSYNGSTIYFRVRGYNADSLPGEWGYQEGAPGGGSGGGSYTLPTATSSVLGGIKVGSGLSITDGVLAATGGGGGSVASAASTAAFPATGDSATLYIATDVGRLFRWTGSVYAEIGPISGGGSDARWDYLKPAAPTSVTAFPGNAQALITWTAPSGVIAQAPIQDYVVQFSSNSGSSWATFSDAISTATSATVTGLANSVAVIFRVAATNGIGTGVFSAASAAVTPGVFDPSTISGLTAWYDASDAATLYSASSGGSLVTADAASVLRWQDKSGNSHHLINSTSGEAPVLKTSLINSRNAIRFDGTDDRLIASALNLTSASASTLVAVMKFRSSSGFAIAVAFGTQSSFGAHTIEKNRSSSRFSFSAGSYTLGSEYSIGAAAPNTNTNSLASVFSSGTLTSYVNNTQDATGSVVASLSSGSGLSVGGYFANGYNADIDACEILYYNRAITSTERGDLHGYLASKWGL